MPMFKAMVEAAEEIILRLHSEDFGQERQQGMTQASAYMQALITHVNHCRSVKTLRRIHMCKAATSWLVCQPPECVPINALTHGLLHNCSKSRDHEYFMVSR